jgi:hypothetical protein
MPNKSKSRNNSRKSTASSQGKPAVQVSEDDYPSILMVNKPPTSRKTTPKSKSSSSSATLESPRPEFLEPLSPKPISPPPPPPTPWEVLGMPEADYWAMKERLQKMYDEIHREIYQQNLVDELKSPRFWLDRIEHMEQEREYFNKKRGWSAMDVACVDRIDAQIQECVDELDRIYAEEDRLETEYD